MSYPYTNTYPTDLPGLREATSLALQEIIQQCIDVINDALAVDAQTPMSFETTQVVIGDPHLINESLICVVGGGREDFTDMTVQEAIQFGTNDTTGFGEFLFTELRVYIHCGEMPNANPYTFVQSRELALARICDSLRRRIFNSKQFYNIQLTSQETQIPDMGLYDTIYGCFVKQIKQSEVRTDFGGANQLYAATLLHVAEIGTVKA